MPPIPLGSEALVIGRNSTMAQVVLDHPSISRRHAVVLHRAKHCVRHCLCQQRVGEDVRGRAVREPGGDELLDVRLLPEDDRGAFARNLDVEEVSDVALVVDVPALNCRSVTTNR